MGEPTIIAYWKARAEKAEAERDDAQERNVNARQMYIDAVQENNRLIKKLKETKNNPVVIVDEDATTWKNLANYYLDKIFKLEDELKNLRRSLVSKTLPKR